MADVRIDAERVTRVGLEETYLTSTSAPALSAADTFLVRNDGQILLRIETGATPATVTVDIPREVDGQTVPGKAALVPASSYRILGPYPPDVYNDALGDMKVTLSAVANIKLALIGLS